MAGLLPFLIFLVTVCTAHVEGKCEDNWIQYLDSCYHLFEDLKEWVVTVAECENHKGHLVSIETAEENDFVKSYARNQTQIADVWIGATDLLREGEYRWTGTENRLTFTDFYLGEPNNDRGIWENCVELETTEFRWNDESCEKRNHYMCETSYSQQNNIIG